MTVNSLNEKIYPYNKRSSGLILSFFILLLIDGLFLYFTLYKHYGYHVNTRTLHSLFMENNWTFLIIFTALVPCMAYQIIDNLFYKRKIIFTADRVMIVKSNHRKQSKISITYEDILELRVVKIPNFFDDASSSRYLKIYSKDRKIHIEEDVVGPLRLDNMAETLHDKSGIPVNYTNFF